MTKGTIRVRQGLTLLELLLVACLIGILAGTSLPFMVTTVEWFYDIARSETAVNQLYDTGLIVSRAVTQDKTLLAKLSLSSNTLSYDGKTLQTGVNATWSVPADLDGAVKFSISTVAEPVETLRFVIYPIR